MSASTESPGGPPEQPGSGPQSGGPPPPPPPPGGGGAPGAGGAPGGGGAQPGYQEPGGGGPGVGQPGGPMVPGGYTAATPMQTHESVVEWLLCAFVPFYNVFWFHRASKELQQWSGGRIDYSPGATIAALTIGAFILVPPFVAIASFAGRVRTARGMAGLPQDTGFWGFFGRLLLLGYGYKWMTDKLNELAVRQPQG